MLTLGLLGEHVAPFYSKTKLSLALMCVCVCDMSHHFRESTRSLHIQQLCMYTEVVPTNVFSAELRHACSVK
jgi:hypothetical protein